MTIFPSCGNVKAMGKEETWVPVAGYEGLYEVSNRGFVRSLDRFEEYVDRGTACKRRRSGRVLRAHPRRGYLAVLLSKDGCVKLCSIHALVCSAFHGARPDGLQAAHLNGVKSDNRAENLKWASAKENMGHQVAHGTRRVGEKAPRAKLTGDDVRNIRRAALNGVGPSAQARQYGVAPGSITAVVRRQTWAHI